MAKSKAQKVQGAQLRNRKTYFYSTFLNWLHWMPGGRFLGIPCNMHEIDLLVRRTRTVMRQAEESGLTFDHAAQAEGMEFWTPHQVIVFFCHGTHLDRQVEAYDALFRKLEPDTQRTQPLSTKDWRYNRGAMEAVSVLAQEHLLLLPQPLPASPVARREVLDKILGDI